jgi:hypothetical protein
VNGFYKEIDRLNRMSVEKPDGGWPHVRTRLEEIEIPGLRKYPDRILIVAIDLDNSPGRIAHFLEVVPEDLKSRVLILGSHDEAETLKTELAPILAENKLPNSFENVGSLLASECRDNILPLQGDKIARAWDTPQLAQVQEAATGFRALVHPIIFK